jgi:hypothetical protein
MLTVYAPVDGVVLPAGLTVVQVSFAGWGMLRVRGAAASTAIPAVNAWVRCTTAFTLTVPVGTNMMITATNAWGRTRVAFTVSPTETAAPSLPALPCLSMPDPCVSVPRHVPRTPFMVPVATGTLGKAPTLKLADGLRSPGMITGAPSHLPVELTRELQALALTGLQLHAEVTNTDER